MSEASKELRENSTTVYEAEVAVQRLTDLEEQRERAITNIIELKEGAREPRTIAILDYAVHTGSTDAREHFRVRAQPEQVEQRVALFERLLLDPDEPVIWIGLGADDKGKVILSGETSYRHTPGAENAHTVVITAASQPSLPFRLAHIIGGKYTTGEALEAEDKFKQYTVYDQILGGKEAIQTYMEILQRKAQANNVSFRKNFWEFAEIHGILNDQGIDVIAENRKLTEFFLQNIETGHKIALDHLQVGLLQSVRDEERIPAEQNPGWNRDEWQKTLLTRTIPALKGMLLAGLILPALDTIDQPPLKTSASTGLSAILLDPHRFLLGGRSETEAQRIQQLREAIIVALAL
jgi:hypothetical protein